MENSSAANYWWNFYGRFNAAYLRFSCETSPFPWRPLPSFSRINEEGNDEKKIKKRREKLAWDLVENLVSWYLHVISHHRFYGEKKVHTPGSRKRRKTVRLNYWLSVSLFIVFFTSVDKIYVCFFFFLVLTKFLNNFYEFLINNNVISYTKLD